jgi:citronellol/citronellal dehydrogenase
MSLKGKRILISGASRGIGLAIALEAAKDGARIAILAKTTEPHPKLPGTIYTAADEIRAAGGEALPLVCDIRDEAQVDDAVARTVETFGGLDACINNASAISLTSTEATPMKRYDLMHQINARGTYMLTRACLPHLKRGDNPHVIMNSPPLNLNPKWFENHVAYTMAKYGMSMCVLGMAPEFREYGIAVNAIWPRTGIATAAMNMIGGDPMLAHCRKPTIMAEAVRWILSQPSAECTGNFFIDDEVLASMGVTDLTPYAVDPSKEPYPDFFLD